MSPTCPDCRNARSRKKRGLRIDWLEVALIVSILTLIGQLCWPSLVEWRRRPTPGSFGIITLDLNGQDGLGLATLNAECVVRLPVHYGTSAGPWPLVVFLHGSRERGDDADRLLRYLDAGPFSFLARGQDLPAILVAPQCRRNTSWWPAAVVECVQQGSFRFAVDPDRIYLVGCSMGGYGTWQTAGEFPKLFAAAVPVCGGGSVEDADALVDVPIWAFHGSEDDVVPVEQSQQMIDAIRAAGGQTRLTLLQGSGHGVCNPVLGRSDLWDWLLRQNRHRSADANAVGKGSWPQ